MSEQASATNQKPQGYPDENCDWETYKKHFNRTFSTPEEEEIRKQCFLETQRKVIERNARSCKCTQGLNNSLTGLTK
uniref:Cathepsin propeptide inhibitor domain-containing protein n=1 Tax=Ditylenchus dipsaci TaxID=166011 RepID=A0A915EHU3_9BILA